MSGQYQQNYLDTVIDTNIQKADIICFCETWLLPSEESPCIKHDHVVLRCDRTTTGIRGGGVMISHATIN